MTSAEDLERQKFELERSRYRMDILRWIVIAAGAIISFAVIDYGKLRLERQQAAADSQRQLLEAYLKATESPEPEVWKRNLVT
jgi:cell division protein FtsB